MLIAVVVAVGAWMFLDYSSRMRDATPAVDTEPASASEAEVETEAPPTPTPTPEKSREPKPKKTEGAPVELITEGVSVQVLNGTNDPAAGDAMAERLSSLGFQVVAVESTSTPYGETTVFWSFPDAEDAALALAEKFDWVADKKPGNLADTVSIHVVVGSDEAGEAPPEEEETG